MSNSSNYTKDVVVFFDGLYKPFTEINFNGYLDPKCITDDIIDFIKKKLKEEYGKKVHFIDEKILL